MRTKLITTALLIITGCLAAMAQNNPYEIDDECYAVFRKVESAVGDPEFKELNGELLRLSREKEDTKAETLYYVEELKNLTKNPSTRENDAKVDDAHKRLKQVAKDFGYKQYFYYSYQLAQNYYYNNGQVNRAFSLAREMQQTALKEHDEYGIWSGDKFLADLYIDQNDFVSAKTYIKDALNLYHSSSDPTIRRQSPTRLYCDMADTFPMGHDSVRFYVTQGYIQAKIHLDSLRCNYYQAKLAILDDNVPLYSRYRDICLSDPELTRISQQAPTFFSLMDNVLDKTIQSREDEILELRKVREIKAIANVCERRGLGDFAFSLEKKLVQKLEERFSEINQAQIAEFNVTMGKAALSADLADTEHKLNRVSNLVTILLSVLLVAILLFLLVYIYLSRKSKRKDRELIGELQEANEKVRMADAAKTRFVQNMSHEVRTPLNAIVGFSQLLSLPDGSFPEEEKEEFAGHIVNNTKMLTMLLDDILNASSMDKGDYKISYETGECSFMAQAAISSAEHRLQPGVSMNYGQDFEGVHEIRTDPRRVQQILINLLTNACKHTSKGSITLRCSLKENPGKVTFSVTDTGPGIPDDQAEKIFERFTKLNDFVQGTGLGLSICRDIASRMDGEVFLDTSYKEGGARFVFTIPDKRD